MKKIVVILGAGSSKDFGLPLASEIFFQADRILCLKKRIGGYKRLEKSISEVEKKLHKIYTNLPKDKKNYPAFEEALTFIWNLRKDNTLYGIDYRAFRSFVDMMGLTFAGSHGFKTYLKVPHDTKKYEAYVESLLKSDNKITFISLNYDIIIDGILDEYVQQGIIKNYNYGLPLIDVDSKKKCRNGGVSLFKPHGSLNLSYCINCGRYFYYEDNIFTAIVNKKDWCDCPFCNQMEKKYKLKALIIPPLYNKEKFINRSKRTPVNSKKPTSSTKDKFVVIPGIFKKYRSFIDEKIVESIKTAEEILIIGYSLPSYDFDFKNLLLKGLVQNQKRLNVPIKIINNVKNLTLKKELHKKYMYLAGQASFLSNKGFYAYLESQGL